MLVKGKQLIAAGCVLSILLLGGCANPKELKAAKADRDRLAAELAQAESRVEELVENDDVTQKELRDIQIQLAAATQQVETCKTQLVAAQTAAEQANTMATASRSDAGKLQIEAGQLREQADKARADAARAQDEVQKAQTSVEKARAEMARCFADAEQSRAAAQKSSEQAGKAQDESRTARAQADTATRKLAEATTQLATTSDQLSAYKAQVEKADAALKTALSKAVLADQLTTEVSKAHQQIASLESTAKAAAGRADTAANQVTDLKAQLLAAGFQIDSLKQTKAKLEAAAKSVQATASDPSTAD